MKKYAIAALAAALCSAAAIAQDSTAAAPAATAPAKQEAPAKATRPAKKAKAAKTETKAADPVKTDAVKPADPKPAAGKAEAAPAETAKAPATGDITIEKMVTAAGVENRDATGEATDFAAGTDKVYCWMKISGPVDSAVKHIWYADGKKVDEIALTLKYATMRTWTIKTVWAGSWKVEAVDANGNVLKTAEFTVAAGEKAPKAGKTADTAKESSKAEAK